MTLSCEGYGESHNKLHSDVGITAITIVLFKNDTSGYL